MTEHRHPLSPLLDHCPKTLLRDAYLDAGWYAREMATVWARNWVCVGRLDDVPVWTIRPLSVGIKAVLLTRLGAGAFAKMVLQQTGDAVEMNQRGIRSVSYRKGRLRPQEFDIHRFHTWVLAEMEMPS